jgi:hypothetical protein
MNCTAWHHDSNNTTIPLIQSKQLKRTHNTMLHTVSDTACHNAPEAFSEHFSADGVECCKTHFSSIRAQRMNSGTASAPKAPQKHFLGSSQPQTMRVRRSPGFLYGQNFLRYAVRA